MIKYLNIIISYAKLVYNLRKLINMKEYDNILVKRIISNIKDSGAIAIKLGQWSIPKLELTYENKVWLNDCEELYDNCNVHSIEHTKDLYKKTFNKNLEDDYIIEGILGSGSIGQVYKVKNINTGEKEVIKVRHPNIDNELWLFKIIYSILNKLYKNIGKSFPFDIESFIDSFEQQIYFINEANNILYYYKIYKDNEYICIPEIKSVSESILIMSYEDSTTIDNKLITDYNKYKVINLLFLFIRNNEIILNYNHGDLHKGNWGIRDNKLVIYDYGFCYSVNKDGLDLVKLIPNTFDAENMNSLEENHNNLIKITEGIIKDNKDALLKKKIKELIEETFQDCRTFSADTNNSEGSPEYMLNIIIEFCKKNGCTLESKLLNYFILFMQCKKYYSMGDAVSSGRSSEILFKKRYIDIIIFCKTHNIFKEYTKYLVDKLNKYDLKKDNIFDTVEYTEDINNELLDLIKKEI